MVICGDQVLLEHGVEVVETDGIVCDRWHFLKGPWHEIFDLCFFHKSTPPKPRIHGLKPFWIWLRICEESWLWNPRFSSQRCQWHRCDKKKSPVNPQILCLKHCPKIRWRFHVGI
jgi:hypothetical protein